MALGNQRDRSADRAMMDYADGSYADGANFATNNTTINRN